MRRGHLYITPSAVSLRVQALEVFRTNSNYTGASVCAHSSRTNLLQHLRHTRLMEQNLQRFDGEII